MIWKIAKKEFLLNLMTFRFAAGTIPCIILTAIFVTVLAKDYQQQLERYNSDVASNEAELRKVKVYRNITPTIYRPPKVLSVFSEGLEKQINNSAKIEITSVPEMTVTTMDINPYLSIFPSLDVSLIFKIVVSVMALLLAFDTISGEREQGTLRLVLSGSIARYQVLLGKLLAGLLTLIISITISFIVCLLILLLHPMADLASSDWKSVAFIYAVSIIFISAMYSIGLFLSCILNSSTTSLVLGLFAWIILAIIIPNGGTYLASRIYQPEPKEISEEQIRATLEKRDRELSEIRKKFPEFSTYDYRGAFGLFYALLCSQRTFEEQPKRFALQEPIRTSYADKVWEIEHNYLNGLTKQRRLANSLSRVSPVCLYENVACVLSATSLDDFQHFANQARIYRNEVIGYIRSQTHNFSSPLYFTRSEKGDLRKHNEIKSRIDREKWRAQKETERLPLDLRDLPRFEYKPQSITLITKKIIPEFGLLLFFCITFFVASHVAFLRYDVR